MPLRDANDIILRQFLIPVLVFWTSKVTLAQRDYYCAKDDHCAVVRDVAAV